MAISGQSGVKPVDNGGQWWIAVDKQPKKSTE
jgi:hypothetical protein